MQSIDGRRKLDFCNIFWIGFKPNGTIIGAELSNIYSSWPPKPHKYFSVGIFEYILASMPNVYLNV